MVNEKLGFCLILSIINVFIDQTGGMIGPCWTVVFEIGIITIYIQDPGKHRKMHEILEFLE